MRPLKRSLAYAWVLTAGLATACLSPSAVPVAPDHLKPYADRAATARGLGFVRPVQAYLIDPESVGQRLEEELGRVIEEEEWEQQFELLKVLGLVAEGSDPLQELMDLQAESVAGYYAALDDRLYVTAPDPEGLQRALADPVVGEILVHELGHALQAQHSRLLDIALGLLQPDDLGFAFASLLEGDALWTEFRDAEEQRGEALPSPGVYEQRFNTEITAGLGEVSPWVRALFLTPYPAGYRYVHRVGTVEGQLGLNRTLREPPMSSAAILEPRRELRGRVELLVDTRRIARREGCEVTTSNAYGQLGLAVWLDVPTTTPLHWQADRAWMIHCGDERSWAWLVEFEDESAAAGLRQDASERAKGLGAKVSRRNQRLLISKGLGPKARAALLVGAEARYYPTLSSWLADHPEVEARLERVREEAGILAPPDAAAPSVRTEGISR